MIYRSLNFSNNEEIFFLVCAKFIIFATLKIQAKLNNFLIKKINLCIHPLLQT